MCQFPWRIVKLKEIFEQNAYSLFSKTFDGCTENVFVLFFFFQKKIRVNSIQSWQAPTSSVANNGQLVANYCQSLAFDHPYLSSNDHCEQWLFQKFFFFCYCFLEVPMNDLELVFLEFKVCFLFICSITRFFIIILCINALHLL